MSDMEEAERKLRAAGFSNFIWGTTPVSPELAAALLKAAEDEQAKGEFQARMDTLSREMLALMQLADGQTGTVRFGPSAAVQRKLG